ncbi:MAG: aminopeptidase [Verrucomicrobia bacterium]|nr:aminopeptidase [Verrucomicrobiota bacterium]
MAAGFHRLLHLASFAALLALGAGCETAAYYSQAARGQMQIWHRRQPIPKLLAAPQTPGPLKERLRLVLRLREFAGNQLGLTPGKDYLSYADLERRFVVWNVHAAPEFSLEARSWWYPIVGRQKYRGYFAEAAARRVADKLRAAGNDVFVGGVAAYSTLGWFHDPVLNTFPLDDERELAELLFHELAHQQVFAAGDTDFNEAFATAVAQEGVRRWLAAENRSAARAEYNGELERHQQFLRLVTAARGELGALYTNAQCNAMPAGKLSSGQLARVEALRRQKEQAFATLRQNYEMLKRQWGGRDDYGGWLRGPLNNARLNTVEAYYRLVPAFEKMLAAGGGDLPRFYAEIRQLAKLPKTVRHQRLEEFMAPARDGR